VTDANVVLGYMNPEAIAGATLKIDRPAALAAIQTQIADPLRLDVLPAAYGITQVANSTMMRALRAVSTERGRDPREFTLVAFGGAGPIHAVSLAESLGMSHVLVPPYPGLFSALGLLLADYRHDYVHSVALALERVEPQSIIEQFAEMEARARTELLDEGIRAEAIRFERQVDLRYSYQVSELTQPFPSVSPGDLQAELSRLFTQAHLQAFGYERDDTIELVSLRLRALASAGNVRFSELLGRMTPSDQTPGETRQAYFGPRHGLQDTVIRCRADIGTTQSGPLIVEEPDTTVVVPPEWSASRDGQENLVLERQA
jgi:N-methylhydantoinase A